MIILDTNVISEPMKPDGDPKVLAWLDDQAAETLYLTSVNLAELLAGLEILPDGKRKAGLHQTLSDLLSRLFEGRVLPFDEQAAREFAPLIAKARSAGRVISMSDGQIAAIAKTRGFTVATRDVAPFEAAGVPIINPWEI
jgi:predicted nucleic acid-binding protein